MSWGERSCKLPCRVPDKCSIETCNVDCPAYIWDGVTKPDSNPSPKSNSEINKPVSNRVKRGKRK